MITILQQRAFGLVWTAALVSQLGDWVLIAALPFYVFAATGSALASGATFLVGRLPTLLFGTVAGVFVDRWDRKRLIVCGELAQGAALLLLLLVRSAGTLWLVYAVAFVEATIALFSGPAIGALLPRVVDGEQVARANSLLSAGENVARLVGSALAGLLMITLSLPGVILLDAATCFISGALLTGLASPPPAPHPAKTMSGEGVRRDGRGAGIWSEWRTGLRIVTRERWVAALFLVPAISLLGDGMFTAVLAAFVAGVLGGSAVVFGWVLTARGLGGLTGGLTLGAASRRLHSPFLISPCLMLIGAVLMAMALFPAIPLTLAAMTVGGITAVGVFVTISTLLQNGVPDQYRGRVLAAYSTCCALATISGNLVGGILGDVLGATPMVGIGGALSVLAGLAALFLLRGDAARRAKRGDLALPDAEGELITPGMAVSK
jgi:MFS family permease